MKKLSEESEKLWASKIPHFPNLMFDYFPIKINRLMDNWGKFCFVGAPLKKVPVTVVNCDTKYLHF